MYKLLQNSVGQVLIVKTVGNTQTSFLIDPANTDYQAYLKWVEAGNTPQAADAATEPADEQGA
jgi:trimethylamine:corrinoid methyltransferase-like protein